MKVHIWSRLDTMSKNYHPEGGLVVIAPSVHAARELLRATPGIPEDSDVFVKEPDASYPISDAEPRVFSFPDAGCC